ncbi:MAG: PIN domain-containing protein [Chloroflexi bacterium]|nr:PIN domain-containing protein [Chloroflexota bacterium]
MNIFVDTSAFLAVLNETDQYHQKAKQLWTEVLASDTVLLSSNYVLLETTALLQHRFGMDSVRLFENSLQPVIEVLWVEESIHKQGMGILITANRRNLSLVDCISFEVMRQARLEKVFTFDPHFSEQGFIVLPG